MIACRNHGNKHRMFVVSSRSQGAMKILKTWFDTKEGPFAFLILRRNWKWVDNDVGIREAAARTTIVIVGMDPKRLSWDMHKENEMAWLKEKKNVMRSEDAELASGI